MRATRRWTTRLVWSSETLSNHVQLLHDGKLVAEMELDEWLRLSERPAWMDEGVDPGREAGDLPTLPQA
jgi:hypothetical protein